MLEAGDRSSGKPNDWVIFQFGVEIMESITEASDNHEQVPRIWLMNDSLYPIRQT